MAKKNTVSKHESPVDTSTSRIAGRENRGSWYMGDGALRIQVIHLQRIVVNRQQVA